jgi:cytochrome b involved in lipid metabolism
VGKAQHNFFRESEKAQSASEFRPISASELAEHKSAQSAWLSLNGTVYDVTNYLKYHPGGRLILQGCGTECSALFSIFSDNADKYHAWVNGEFLLKKYKLGYLVRDSP